MECIDVSESPLVRVVCTVIYIIPHCIKFDARTRLWPELPQVSDRVSALPSPPTFQFPPLSPRAPSPGLSPKTAPAPSLPGREPSAARAPPRLTQPYHDAVQ